MTGKPAASGCDHPTYPEYRERFGEDPARVLFHLEPLSATRGNVDRDVLDAFPRIRGIGDVALVRAYLDVETDRDGPRKAVVAACNQRLDELTQRAAATSQHAVATDGGGRR